MCIFSYFFHIFQLSEILKYLTLKIVEKTANMSLVVILSNEYENFDFAGKKSLLQFLGIR